MKKIYIIVSILICGIAFSGCDSFLDRQPDDQLTSKNVFDKKESTWKYLVNVYSFILDYADHSGYGSASISIPASDEASGAYTGSRAFALWTHNQLTPMTTHGGYRSGPYKNQYKGIREATFFMQKVYDCPELTDEEKKIWSAEARFLRAYYYTELLKWTGPVVFLGDKLADLSDPNLDNVDRASWKTIVDWVQNEFLQASEDLPDSWGSADLGRATKGAALAIRARLLLYNARPLFNGQNGTGMYDDIVNKSGEKLFNTEYDRERWKVAADAAKAVMDLNLYHLVDDKDKTPLENIHEAFMSLNSPENIFTKQQGGSSNRLGSTPAGIGGTSYGGISLTQKMVDAFAMENGRYPITNMDTPEYKNGCGEIVIDPESGYSETGSTDFVNPFFEAFPQKPVTDKIKTMNMYVGREPRFYANVFWSGQTWVAGSVVKKNIQFYQKGGSGPMTSNNYPPTGYLNLKFIDPTLATTSGAWGNLSWPMIRYADILLMYAEALIEYDCVTYEKEILDAWNKVRSRAGVDNIEEVYPEIKGNVELMRKYIRRERMVELCFEGHRYFDTRTWMTALIEDNGEVVGCNIKALNHNIGGDYWKRTSVFETYGEGGFMTRRSFTEKNYLFPVNQEELDRVPGMTQNLGW